MTSEHRSSILGEISQPEALHAEAPAVTRARRRRRSRSRRNFYYLAPAFLFLTVLGAYPLEELFRMSVSRISTSTIINTSWPYAGLANFRHAVSQSDFGPVLRNTLVLVTVSVLVTLAGGLVCAIVLERDSLGNRITQGILVFLWAMPPLVIGFIWKFLLASDGLIPAVLVKLGVGTAASPPALLAQPRTSLIVISLVTAWIGSAFASLIFRASILSVDKSLIEAASIDGAGTWSMFWHITVPALRPALLVQSLLTVIYGFRIFDLPYVMTSGGPGQSTTTLPYLAYQLSFGSLDFASGSAVAVICVGIVMIFAALYLWSTRQELDR
jgi:multiple sugar transport system permease protein